MTAHGADMSRLFGPPSTSVPYSPFAETFITCSTQARGKAARSMKLDSDETIALQMSNNGNSNNNQNSNNQNDLSPSASRRSSLRSWKTSLLTTSPISSVSFKLIVCTAVGQHPELFEAQKTKKIKPIKEIWKGIEKEIKESHPELETTSTARDTWNRCRQISLLHKKRGKMDEIDKLVFDILSKNPSEGLSRRLEAINRSVGQRDNLSMLESTEISAEVDTTPSSKRHSLRRRRSKRSCRSSVANYKNLDSDFSFKEYEIDFSTDSPSSLDGNKIVPTDQNKPGKEFRLLIDRVMSQLA